jgi:predicted phage terminase large subunit-like protein
MRLSDFRQRKNEVLEKMHEKAKPLPEKGKQERIRRAKSDYFYFFKTYLPHYAENDFAEFHREMIGMLEERPRVVNPMVVAAPRGFAKSAHISFGYVLWSIVRKSRRFIEIISANDDLASDLVEFAKLELESNTSIRGDFGEISTGGEAGDFRANGIRICAMGVRTMTRGKREREARPDLVILDDIEKDDEANSPEIVKKTIKIIKEGIYPSIAPSGNLFIVGTVIRKRSVVGTILFSSEEPYSNWNRRIYRALTEDPKRGTISLWEARYPVADLLEIKKNVGLIAFEKEYNNNPRDDEDSLFREDWIRYYHPMEFPERNLTAAMFVDPSARGQKRHDYKAIVVVGLDREQMRYPVLRAWIRKGSIEEMLHATFRIYDEFREIVKVVGLEANGFQALLQRDYERLAKEYGYYLPLRLVTNTQNKEDRIERLSPLVERGMVMFRKDWIAGSAMGTNDDTNLLVEQLLYFGNSSVHDDGPDALENAVRLLEAGSGKIGYTPGKQRESNRITRGFIGRNGL